MVVRSKNFVISIEGAKTFHLPDFGLEFEKFLEVSCALIVSYIKILIIIIIIIIITIIIIHLTANGLSPGGSGSNACT